MTEATTVTAQGSFPPIEHYEDPYPLYSELRETCPVYRVPGTDTYVLLRWDDQVWATRHSELFSSAQPPDDQFGYSATCPTQRYGTMPPTSRVDPPTHTKLRRTVSQLLTPGRLKSYEPLLEREVRFLLDNWGDRREIEFVQDLAVWLPTRVIGAILGLPRDVYPQLKAWSDDLLMFLAPGHEPEVAKRLEESAAEFLNYCGDEIVARRQHPKEDGLTELALAHEADGELYDLDQMIGVTRELIVGANETTTFMMTHVLREVLEHPEYLGAMTDRAQMARLVDESLRLESVAASSFRRTTRDVELRGVTIPANSKVLLAWSAGNRDPEVFEDPSRFDPNRENLKQQLGFGHGKHFCAGAPLARLEAVIVFREMASRYRAIRLAPNNVFRQVPNYPRLRMLSSLRIEVDPI